MLMSLLAARRNSPRRSRRAFSILYVGLVMIGAFGLISLAVDLGRVRVARMQLTTAADAAALAGTQDVRVPDLFGPNGARADAKSVAASNVAVQGLGVASAVTLQDSDVNFGLYRMSTGTLTLYGQKEPAIFGGQTVDFQSCNACKIDAAQRTAARGNPVGLFFAPIVGISNVDVAGRAIAWTRGQGSVGFGIVGLDWIRLNGTTNTDSYNAASGTYGGGNIHNLGTIGSNGTITMVGTSDVHGNAMFGTDATLSTTNNASVHGWTAPLDYTLAYPVDMPPGGYSAAGYNDFPISAWLSGSANSSSTLPKKNDDQVIIPGGTYAIKTWSTGSQNTVTINATAGTPVNIYISGNFNMSKGTLTLNCGSGASGKITFYISGSVNMQGGADIRINVPSGSPQHQVSFYVNGDWDSQGGNLTNNNANPGSLYISMTGPGTTMDMNTALFAHIMAPLTDITFHGNANNPPADFFGWVIGKTLTVRGNSQLHYDESLAPQGGPIRAALIK